MLNCLNHFAYNDAIFLSERLHAEMQSEESLYLLALSHFRSGTRTLRAYHLLKERQLKLPKSKYLLGRCCLDLNKYAEAESTLTCDCSLSFSSSSSSSSSSANHSASSATLATSKSVLAAAAAAVSASAPTTSSSSKPKLYDEIIKEYGVEYASNVLQMLATVYR